MIVSNEILFKKFVRENRIFATQIGMPFVFF